MWLLDGFGYCAAVILLVGVWLSCMCLDDQYHTCLNLLGPRCWMSGRYTWGWVYIGLTLLQLPNQFEGTNLMLVMQSQAGMFVVRHSGTM